MNFTKLLIIFLFSFWTYFLKAQYITYEGKQYLLNGINIPWNSFGSDVGTHYQWGALYDSTWFENTFTELENYGVNCVRLWIHCDGRTSPEFNDSGYVTGVDTNFFSNLDDIFARAQNHHIMLLPCLWSFDMTKDYRSSAGQYAGWHADLIRDSLKTKSYIDSALIPMVNRYANQCNLLAWEIINEPEWSMNIPGGGNTIQQVNDYEMQRFVGMQAEAIHHYSNKMVTLGSASLKWNSDTYTNTSLVEGNYWSDSVLFAAYPHSMAYLDFYQIHYYDWMYDLNLDPFDTAYPLSFWNLDKAVIVGESGSSWAYSSQEMLDNASVNQFAGLLFWSYNANDGYGAWPDSKNELLNNYNLSKSSILFTSCDSTASVQTPKIENTTIQLSYFNHAVTIYTMSIQDVNYEMFDMLGRSLEKGIVKDKTQIDVSYISKGWYLIRLKDKSECIHSSKIYIY